MIVNLELKYYNYKTIAAISSFPCMQVEFDKGVQGRKMPGFYVECESKQRVGEVVLTVELKKTCYEGCQLMVYGRNFF